MPCPGHTTRKWQSYNQNAPTQAPKRVPTAKHPMLPRMEHSVHSKGRCWSCSCEELSHPPLLSEGGVTNTEGSSFVMTVVTNCEDVGGPHSGEPNLSLHPLQHPSGQSPVTWVQDQDQDLWCGVEPPGAGTQLWGGGGALPGAGGPRSGPGSQQI